MPINVLYEDNHIIAVEKPAGMLVQEDDSRGKSPEQKAALVTLMGETKKFLKEKYKKPGNVFLGLVHRLDRPVGGIVLFGKTSKGAARLSEQFREHSADKVYHAWVEGSVKGSGAATTLVNYLIKDENRRRADVYDEPLRNALRAELTYSIVKRKDNRSEDSSKVKHLTLLKIHLKTGRFHQIRAQLAHSGHPIVGDAKYGAQSGPNGGGDFTPSPIELAEGSIALWATSITFETATGGETKTVSMQAPS
jgi:23S rRNA pseudouridine1911/1915/1917 synthase